MGQIYQPDSDPNDSIRYYLNSRASSEDSWLTEPAIQSHLAYRDLYGRAVGSSSRLDGVWKDFIDEDEEITLGFDGSIRNDSTALVGCRVSDGLLFLIKLQQRPDNADPDWRVDRDGFDAAVRRMFENYNVIGCFADAHFESMIGGWEAEYGRGMKVFARGQSSMMKFWTNNWSQDMYRALQCAHSSFEYAPEPVEEGSLTRIIFFCVPTRVLCRISVMRSGVRRVGVIRFIRRRLRVRTRLMRAWLAFWLMRRVRSIWASSRMRLRSG